MHCLITDQSSLIRSLSAICLLCREERKREKSAKFHKIRRKLSSSGAPERRLSWDAIQQIRYCRSPLYKCVQRFTDIYCPPYLRHSCLCLYQSFSVLLILVRNSNSDQRNGRCRLGVGVLMSLHIKDEYKTVYPLSCNFTLHLCGGLEKLVGCHCAWIEANHQFPSPYWGFNLNVFLFFPAYNIYFDTSAFRNHEHFPISTLEFFF